MGTNTHETGDRNGADDARLVVDLHTIGDAPVDLAGGKGASLAELAAIDGVEVPRGVCITTSAYLRHVSQVPGFDDLLRRLADVDPTERDRIRDLAAAIRDAMEATPIDATVAAAITSATASLGEQAECAVRSSATAEDSAAASFAGQHDSFLNVVGSEAVLEHVRRVWASLFSERAVAYRIRGGIDHRVIEMAVVVQHLVAARASGVLFTADPITSNRRDASVEAVLGLGEALVSGRVVADVFKVRDGQVVARSVAAKPLALQARPGGGTTEQLIDDERQSEPSLTDEQLVRLVQLGRQIEARLGGPQDIEWCLVDDRFVVVQSRPITTLFPIPASQDADQHVYLSVGHQQMMTDAMRPLGLSMHQLIAMVPMHEAGGRLFVDATRALSNPSGRERLLETFGQADPLVVDALKTVLDRDDFIPLTDDPAGAGPAAAAAPVPAPIEADPAIVDQLIQGLEASLTQVRQEIQTKSGSELFDFIEADIAGFKQVVFDPRSMQVIMAAMEATWWLNERLETWLGEKNASDALTQSVPGNVTSEMGLALLDVADVIRPYPEMLEVLDGSQGDEFMDRLLEVDGGQEAVRAIADFLERFGMRCAGEIDITRPRWAERPSTLVPVLLGNVRNFEQGAGRRRFEQGLRAAHAAEERLLAALHALPDGAAKADEAARMIERLRTFSGYREYPKYSIVSRHFVYKQALLAEAGRLAGDGVLREAGDMAYLTFAEFHEAVRTGHADRSLIERRKEEFRTYEALTPPRVLTSDGEALSGSYGPSDAPAGALIGLAVSGGTVEGRARVVLDMADADLEPGDILVTTFTDPSWTPAFVAIEGLVTEVGGLMTHGAVIAREYGLPAVVGVAQATELIRDGQRIRVHGTQGYVEFLS